MKLRDTPCHCGWKFLGFHICVDLAAPNVSSMPKPKVKHRRYSGSATAAKLGALETAREARWDAHHEANKDRDEAIVRRYRDDVVGLKKIAGEFGIGYETAMNVIRRHESATGETVMRGRGTNVRHMSRAG